MQSEGEITPAEARAQDVVEVVRGDESLLDSFADTFHIARLTVESTP